jgi:Zn-dependent peptidase ImmA (M78 family)
VEPLKNAWEQMKNNEELLAQINEHFERIEKMVLSRTSLLVKEKDSVESVDLKEDTVKKKKRKRPTSNIERPTSNKKEE